MLWREAGDFMRSSVSLEIRHVSLIISNDVERRLLIEIPQRYSSMYYLLHGSLHVSMIDGTNELAITF